VSTQIDTLAAAMPPPSSEDTSPAPEMVRQRIRRETELAAEDSSWIAKLRANAPGADGQSTCVFLSAALSASHKLTLEDLQKALQEIEEALNP
jgi:hypothetical protein